MTDRRVVIVPCSGIGETYGSVSREAAYSGLMLDRIEKTKSLFVG
jgi:hypothetical protein